MVATLIMTVAMIVGGWSIQQAYASGPADVVISCLTVGDPLTAVILGSLLLGEGAQLTPATSIAMVCCALAAAAGVRLLAKHHRRRSPHRPSRSTTPRNHCCRWETAVNPSPTRKAI